MILDDFKKAAKAQEEEIKKLLAQGPGPGTEALVIKAIGLCGKIKAEAKAESE